MYRFIALAAVLLSFVISSQGAYLTNRSLDEGWRFSLDAPDGNITVDMNVVDGVPLYSMEYKDKAVIKPSALGIELTDGDDLMNGFEIVNTSASSYDETWQPVWGESRDIRNRYNELLVELRQPSTARYMNMSAAVIDIVEATAMSGRYSNFFICTVVYKSVVMQKYTNLSVFSECIQL